MVKIAIVNAKQENIRTKLSEALSSLGYTVQAFSTEKETLEELRYAPVSLLISDANPTDFAFFIKSAVKLRPKLNVHLFHRTRVFCFYPMWEQSELAIRAIAAAGLKFPSTLLQYTRCKSETVPQSNKKEAISK
jgi:response regulator RpfG family c-di-GMP phosphodiesterase